MLQKRASGSGELLPLHGDGFNWATPPLRGRLQRPFCLLLLSGLDTRAEEEKKFASKMAAAKDMATRK
jgi:hypothetical protein